MKCTGMCLWVMHCKVYWCLLVIGVAGEGRMQIRDFWEVFSSAFIGFYFLEGSNAETLRRCSACVRESPDLRKPLSQQTNTDIHCICVIIELVKLPKFGNYVSIVYWHRGSSLALGSVCDQLTD